MDGRQHGISIPNFSALSQFVNPVEQAGKFAMEYGTRIRADEREAAARKDRADDVAFRNQQAETAKEQWGKQFGLQQAADTRAQAQEGRHVTEFDRKLLGDKRLAEYNQRLSGLLTRGEMGDTQAAKVNAEVERLAAQGVKPEDMAGKLGKLAQFSAPKGPRAQAAAIQQAGFESPDYAAEPLLKLQESKAEPFLKQAAADDLYAQQQALQNQRITAEQSMQAQKMKHEDKLLAGKTAGVPMSKFDPKTGMTYNIQADPTNVKSLIDQGFSPGKGVHAFAPTGGRGSEKTTSPDKIFEEAAGTGGLVTKRDLAVKADQIKAMPEYRHIPKVAIDNIIAAEAASGLFTDRLRMDKVKEQLNLYR